MVVALIFDLDGVIADTEKFHTEAKYQVLSENGVELPKDEIRERFAGVSSEKMFSIIFNESGIAKDPDKAAGEKRERYMELVEGNITDIGGVKKLLKYISGEYFLAIASSSAPQNIELVLDETGLDSFFEVKVSAKEEGLESKPAPDVYVEAAERLGVRPEDCLALEDSINGVESAKNAGMEVVGYSEEKEDLPADIVIGDMLDLRRKEII